MNEEHIAMIKDCMKRISKLSEWEAEFIQGLSHRLHWNYPLSKRQYEILDEIWEKVT